MPFLQSPPPLTHAAPSNKENTNTSSISTNISKKTISHASDNEHRTIKRLPILSFLGIFLHDQDPNKVFRPFKTPWKQTRSAESQHLSLIKTLGTRRRSVGLPTMTAQPIPLEEFYPEPVPIDIIDEENKTDNNSVLFVELILWKDPDNEDRQVLVPGEIAKFLRPHQREGVQFMFDCVAGVNQADRNGCILADDMGLGKTLQSIALMYTLLCTSIRDPTKPTIHRAIIVCPTSLVKNWSDEVEKWLPGRVRVLALFESNRDTVIKGIQRFLNNTTFHSPQVLIISYETFRMHAAKFHAKPESCDLLICDEAHRLKNAHSQINRALSTLTCRRRVLLSGTPMQNDLEEFYAMADFTNPEIFGSITEFRKQFVGPILRGREPDSTDTEQEKAQACSSTLCDTVNRFILRRGNILNAKHLPPKLMQIVCCPLSTVQQKLYDQALESKVFQNLMRQQNANVLPFITALKKLCNHPMLLFNEDGKKLQNLPGFDNCHQLLNSYREAGSSHRSHTNWSGKLLLLDRLMRAMRASTTDRIVIVSNYTQTLDIVSTLCKERSWPFVRLDGTISSTKRQKMVDTFNAPGTQSFAFLLSSKAGGCGLNLIGANRLVLFDPDWNPATDKQAAARVWREGQAKMCYIYRFLATGTIEEKIFQRQLSKEGLQSIVDDQDEVNSLSAKDLKKLFGFQNDTDSDTHDRLKCRRCTWRIEDEPSVPIEALTQNILEERCDESLDTTDSAGTYFQPQIGMPREEDLNNWAHHRFYTSVDDPIMQQAITSLRNVAPEQTSQIAKPIVSFAFSCRVDWDLLQRYRQKDEKEQVGKNKSRVRKRSDDDSKEKSKREAVKSEGTDSDLESEDGSETSEDDDAHYSSPEVSTESDMSREIETADPGAGISIEEGNIDLLHDASASVVPCDESSSSTMLEAHDELNMTGYPMPAVAPFDGL